MKNQDNTVSCIETRDSKRPHRTSPELDQLRQEICEAFLATNAEASFSKSIEQALRRGAFQPGINHK